jgi:two-component system CheB/CheR fusion protein
MHPFVPLAVEQARVHAILLLDLQGTIVGWLGGAEAHLGYTAEEAVGRPVSVIFLPEDVAQGVPELEREMAAKTGEANDDRWQLRKDGAKIWVTGSVTPLREHGRLVGYLKVLRDRTDLKTHIEAIERRVVSEQERNERKDRFVAALAHDLRNPLLALRLSVDLLDQCGPTEEDARRAVQTMRHEIEFVRRMIDNLMESARGAAGKIKLNLRKIVLQQFVREVVAGFPPHDVRLELIMHAAPIELAIDPVRMRQALSNLIDNGLKHTPPGGLVSVKVALEGDDVVIRVEDGGRGIAPEFLQHVFELFTQAETAGDAGDGLGLGLSIVKDVAMLHGGTVQALSDGLGKGSSFILRIPKRTDVAGS